MLAVPRLVFDLARFIDDDDLESVIEQLLQRKLTNIPRLFAAGRRLGKPGRDGTARFSRVLRRRPLWAKPKHSDHEVRLLRALRAPGYRPRAAVPARAAGRPTDTPRRWRPEPLIGVEVDHVTWHGGRVDGQHDKWRDRQCGRIGWHVSRVTDEDVDKRLLSDRRRSRGDLQRPSRRLTARVRSICTSLSPVRARRTLCSLMRSFLAAGTLCARFRAKRRVGRCSSA